MTRRPRAPTTLSWILLFAVSAFLAVRGLAEIALGGSVWSPIIEQHIGASWDELLADQPGTATVINFLSVLSGLFAAGFGITCATVAGLGSGRATDPPGTRSGRCPPFISQPLSWSWLGPPVAICSF